MTSERERVLELIRRHGWNATAFQTLESGFQYWFLDDDACVAYVDTREAWVAAGAPIASNDALLRAVVGFIDAARAAGRRCCFFGTEDRLATAVADRLSTLLIGEQPVWDPRDWPSVLAQKRSLREQLRRARAKGVTVRKITSDELESGPTKEAMERVIARWLSGHAMAPMEFLVSIEPFTFPSHRRCFIAEREGRTIGFAAVVPVPAREGWFIEDLLRDPSAPSGTSELLVDAVMRWAAEEGSRWLTLGLAPLAGDIAGPLQLAKKSGALLYDFEGLHSYKAKLGPSSWTPIYLSYAPGQSAWIAIFDSLVAFTRVGLVRFGLRSLLRGPRAVVRALAVLLVPWTILLCAAPAERWFGASWVKWSWVAFDVAMAAGLFRQLAGPRPWLGITLAIAATTDALLTLLQAALWNLPRATHVLELLVVAVASTAPILAAVVLWGASRAGEPSTARAPS